MNGVKFNPTDNEIGGARDAVKFTKYVAALNKKAQQIRKIQSHQ